jgi:hypothetical protein
VKVAKIANLRFRFIMLLYKSIWINLIFKSGLRALAAMLFKESKTRFGRTPPVQNVFWTPTVKWMIP